MLFSFYGFACDVIRIGSGSPTSQLSQREIATAGVRLLFSFLACQSHRCRSGACWGSRKCYSFAVWYLGFQFITGHAPDVTCRVRSLSFASFSTYPSVFSWHHARRLPLQWLCRPVQGTAFNTCSGSPCQRSSAIPNGNIAIGFVLIICAPQHSTSRHLSISYGSTRLRTVGRTRAISGCTRCRHTLLQLLEVWPVLRTGCSCSQLTPSNRAGRLIR